MTDDDMESTRKAIDRISADLQARLTAATEVQGTDSGPCDAAEAAQAKHLAERLWWVFRAAAAHSQGDMPWRAHPPTEEDAAWCEQLIEAVRAKRARPPHPDPDIEQALLDALPS